MKTQTFVTYEISNGLGANILEVFDTWEEVLHWEKANEKEHPDWRVTRYQVKQIVITETILK